MMQRMTVENLRVIKERVIKEKSLNERGDMARITVHMGTCGIASGAEEVMDKALAQLSRSGRSNIIVTSSGCIGICSREPLVTVEMAGKEPVIYEHVDPRKMEQIFKGHVLGGKIQEPFALVRGRAVDGEERASRSDQEKGIPHVSEFKFFSLQKSWVLRNRGLIDPEKIDDYIWRDGYFAAAKALLDMKPDEIIGEVKESGLRDRGKRGFPTGIKWEFCAASKGDVKYVLCSADEGDPGSFMERSVTEADPHAVLEGMIIAARAINAHQGFIYCRAEYSLLVKRLHLAIEQARHYGLLGDNILGSGFDFDIEVHQGAGAFVCGEETALMASIEDGREMPRPCPPFPAVSGLWKKPTILNNVETFANIPQILLRGAEEYAGIGTESSKGTKVLALTGKVNNIGLVEVPMGTTVGEIIFDIGDGIAGKKRFKAAQLGGPLGGCLPAEHLNIPIDYEAINRAGAIMGSGMVVMDDDTCMVDLARYFVNICQDESCGKCTLYPAGIKRVLEILERICQGKGQEDDIGLLESLAQGIKESDQCGLGNPVLSTLRYFREEYESHIRDKRCPAAVCSALFKSPCQHTCPLEMDIPAYVALVRARRIDDAYKILKRTNPFSSICGRVCGHPCQLKCRRGQLDEPVAIMHLERYIADHAKRPKVKSLPKTRKERIAVVGSGPSGLTAALELSRRGYGVKVFEELPEAGGMLRYGIPAYRLPRKELDREIQEILDTGIELKTHTRVGREISFSEIENSFDAIYLAAGAHKSCSPGIPGEEAGGVVGAVEFLRAYNMGQEVKVGKQVAVIGGGDSAVAAARTAVRLGAGKVTIYYRRERKDMPAQEWEVKAAEEEGVQIETLAAPVRVIPQYGKAVRLELTRTRLGKFDRDGRKKPEPILGSEFRVKADTVISAVGRAPDLEFLPEGNGLWRDNGFVRVGKDLRTGHPKVWAGGDVVAGPAMVIDAIKAGRDAASAIDSCLRTEKGDPPWVAPAEEAISIPFEIDKETPEQPQVPMPEVEASLRRKDFCEVEVGYTLEMAVKEARRCMRCDTTTG